MPTQDEINAQRTWELLQPELKYGGAVDPLPGALSEFGPLKAAKNLPIVIKVAQLLDSLKRNEPDFEQDYLTGMASKKPSEEAIKRLKWLNHPTKGIMIDKNNDYLTHADWAEGLKLKASGKAYDRLNRGEAVVYPDKKEVKIKTTVDPFTNESLMEPAFLRKKLLEILGKGYKFKE